MNSNPEMYELSSLKLSALKFKNEIPKFVEQISMLQVCQTKPTRIKQ